jgi:hypothetical protein
MVHARQVMCIEHLIGNRGRTIEWRRYFRFARRPLAAEIDKPPLFTSHEENAYNL